MFAIITTQSVDTSPYYYLKEENLCTGILTQTLNLRLKHCEVLLVMDMIVIKIITFLFVFNADDNNMIKITVTVPTTAMSSYKEKFLTWRRCKSLRLQDPCDHFYTTVKLSVIRHHAINLYDVMEV